MRRRICIFLFVWVPAAFVVGSLLLVLIFKWAPVTVTPLMLIRDSRNGEAKITRKWVPLEKVSDAMIKAVIASEDNKFLYHKGFDIDEMERMMDTHIAEGKPVRGCSTISQQTAKNCFTFCSKSFFRKGVEAWYTVLIERIWGKRRIMEVYLNVAETGPGTFGVEAAALRYFNVHASELTMDQASALACCLPNPLRRTPDWTWHHLGSHIARIYSVSETIDLRELE